MRRAPSRREFLGVCAIAARAMLRPSTSRADERIERQIPRTGEALPVVGLGTWQVFDVAGDEVELSAARETLRLFVERGGRMVDSSPKIGRAHV